MKRRYLKQIYYYRKIDIYRLADDLARLNIDIAPTRTAWVRVAREIADSEGESGRRAFHMIAAVWPDYNAHDSELCFNRALKKADGSMAHMPFIIRQCEKHHLPILTGRYFRGNPLKFQAPKPINKSKAMAINYNTFSRMQRDGRSVLGLNQLIDLLLRLLPQDKVLQSVDDYCIGFDGFLSNTMGDAITFWQIDDGYKLVNAKRIYYQWDGHRDKRYNPLVLYPHNEQCLFGLHLLDTNNDCGIGIVESEKTALIMSVIHPALLWMATGSLDNFNEKFLRPLKNRRIIAFPDLDNKRGKKSKYSYTYCQWLEAAKRLNKQGYNIVVKDLLEKLANTSQRLAKWDIADFILNDHQNNGTRGILS